MSGRKRNNLNVLCLTLAMSIFNVSVCIHQGGQRPPFVHTSRGSPGVGLLRPPPRGEPNPEPRTLTSKKPVVVRVCGHFGFRKTEPRTRTQTARRAKKSPPCRAVDKAGGFSYNGCSGWCYQHRPRIHEGQAHIFTLGLL